MSFQGRMKGFSKLKFLQLFLGCLLLGILGYNFYVANDLKYETEGDAESFISLGASLAKFQKYGHVSYKEGNLVEAFRSKEFPESKLSYAGHSTWRPPVWPFLIAGIFLIFGYNLTYVLIFKFLLHFLALFLFFRTLKILKLKETAIIIGVFLYGISPAWQLYSRVFLSEAITLFFVTLWVYLLVRFIKNKSSWLPQALVSGILVLCHPYYIFLPFSVYVILFIRKQITLKLFILSATLCAAVISTWIIRNFIVLDISEVVLTTSSGAVMAKGWNQQVPDKHTNTKGDLAEEELVLLNYDYDKDKRYNEVERMQLYKNATLHFMRSNPDLIVPIIEVKLLSAFNPFPETPRPGILETGRWLFQFFSLLGLFYILIFTRNKLIQSLAVGLILSTIGITILTYSGFRFRMPQVGMELIFITFVINDIVERFKCRNLSPNFRSGKIQE